MIDIRLGDCLEVLRTIPDGMARMCVTSPPYYGLRDYGVDGQIGLEATPDAFVAKMVEVFREVRRVLADDGTCWLNLGDSYASQPPGSTKPRAEQGKGWGVMNPYSERQQEERGKKLNTIHASGLASKQLLGIPWRVAFALQADGWFLRSDIIWHKPNPMPESVRDRPTKAHEYVFLLSKQPRYYYDAEAVREPHATAATDKRYRLTLAEYEAAKAGSYHDHSCDASQGMMQKNKPRVVMGNPAGRNARTVWTITPRPFKAWTQSSRLVPVAWGVLSGDTTHKASPDCPVHSSSDHRDSTPECDANGADSSSRNGCNGSHPEPCTLPDCGRTGQHREPLTLARSSDSPLQTHSPTANGHSTQSHRTDPDPSTTQPCTPSVQTGSRTGCTEAERESICRDHGTHESNTSSGDSPDGRRRRTPDCTAGTQAAPDWIGTSLESLRERGCTCTFYVTKTEKTSHFATFPAELAERCIKAGSSERGKCPECGAAWVRVVEPTPEYQAVLDDRKAAGRRRSDSADSIGLTRGTGNPSVSRLTTTTGWRPTCSHDLEPVPDMVLDPFAGAGTVGLVCQRLGRDHLGVELNPAYRQMAIDRIASDSPMPLLESAIG